MNFRITKYNPKLRIDGNYLPNEWTSISEIGSVFGSEKLKKEDYLIVETNYLKALKLILDELNINKLKIVGIEKHDDNIGKNSNITYGNKDHHIYKISEEGKILNKEESLILSKLILRENLWCYLVHDNIIIKFGYDYYLNIIIDEKLDSFSKISSELNLFIEG
jgi:hypothetical protein